VNRFISWFRIIKNSTMPVIKVSSVGCCLLDFVYQGISLRSGPILPYLSKFDGDGGIAPGKLVFTSDLERYAGKDYKSIIRDITSGRKPDSVNIGGPGVVAMIHLAQMAKQEVCSVSFYGAVGNDDSGLILKQMIQKTPLSAKNLSFFPSDTPFTQVLSDPDFDEGHGERSFINNIGAAHQLYDPGADFYTSELLVFGGTALVPGIHNSLSSHLKRAKSEGAFTVVHTVYDFLSQQNAPTKPWKFLDHLDDYPLIDLLMMDREEALRISGKASAEEAMHFFVKAGVGGLVITQGSGPVLYYASGKTYHTT